MDNFLNMALNGITLIIFALSLEMIVNNIRWKNLKKSIIWILVLAMVLIFIFKALGTAEFIVYAVIALPFGLAITGTREGSKKRVIVGVAMLSVICIIAFLPILLVMMNSV